LRFSAVYRVGGSKSLPLFIPETGVGQRVKKRGFYSPIDTTPQANVIADGNRPKPRIWFIMLHENDMHTPTMKTALKIRCRKGISVTCFKKTPP